MDEDLIVIWFKTYKNSHKYTKKTSDTYEVSQVKALRKNRCKCRILQTYQNVINLMNKKEC